VDIYKPQYVVSADLGILNYTETPKLTGTTYMATPKQMALHNLPMKWLCKMANNVLGVNRELLEYHHLIANQTTRAMWQHSYGNEINFSIYGPVSDRTKHKKNNLTMYYIYVKIGRSLLNYHEASGNLQALPPPSPWYLDRNMAQQARA
jgi:hypothetical protein